MINVSIALKRAKFGKDVVKVFYGLKREKELSQKFLLRFFIEQINLLKDCGQFGTANNYYRAYKMLSLFLQGQDIHLTRLNVKWIEQYNEFLLKRKLKRNSISFYMRILRAIYNKAVRLGFVEGSPIFQNVYTGIDSSKKKAISEKTVHQIKNLNLEYDRNLEFARDIFLFSLFTRGMAFVDVVYLKKTNIQNGNICYTRHKTGKYLSIKLEPCMIEIINRYGNKTDGSPFIFSFLKECTPQENYRQYKSALRVYNNRLRKLSMILKLEFFLSSYTARHTWATLARNNNIPISIISAAMGHSSERTTQIYIDSLDNSLIDNANNQILSYFNNKSLSC